MASLKLDKLQILSSKLDGTEPKCSALANIFVGYYENDRFTSVEKPLLYTGYVDATFAIFISKAEADKFFTALNSQHSALKFTMQKEANQTLPLLNVKIEHENGQFLTSVYRKLTFTETQIYRSIYSLGFIWTIKTHNQAYRDSSTPSSGYLFQKQTST